MIKLHRLSQVSRKLLSVSLATLFPGMLAAGIIGNIPLEQMKAESAIIVAGSIGTVSKTATGSTWTIRVLKTYSGSVPSTISVPTEYSPSTDDVVWLRSHPGIFMISRSGSLVRRTGSIRVTDYYVPIVGELAKTADPEVAFCVDWMRGVTDPASLIVLDFALAAQYCAAEPARGDAIQAYLASSGLRTDRIVSIGLGLARGESSALKDLQAWLADPSVRGSSIAGNLQFQLGLYASPDLTSVQRLRELAESAADGGIRRSAATSLLLIHSDESWADLTLLLNSPDPDIRGIAISGLYQTVISGLGEHPFERPLMQQGRPVKRHVRQRPRVPDSAIPHSGMPGTMSVQSTDDFALVAFWKSYAAQNR